MMSCEQGDIVGVSAGNCGSTYRQSARSEDGSILPTPNLSPKPSSTFPMEIKNESNCNAQ
jgi:hypothetical protein